MYSVPMALVDFLPVCFFGLAAYILQKDLYSKMSKGAYALFCAGTIDVFMAGFLKALYKLLYALNICDFEPLTKMFFPVQALGFMMCGVAVACMLRLKQGKNVAYAAAPVLYSGTMIFVMFMVMGVISFDTGLAAVALKMKKKGCAVLLAFSCFAALTMGYLSSKDFTNPMFNWIGEAINTLGQFALFYAVRKLDKAGLSEFNLKGE